jgi:transcriptional regulator with XRE-family HTH domain
MTARKKAGRARKTKVPGKPKKASRKKAKASPKRKPPRSIAASLAERLSGLVEQAAAGALRLAVDTGGREIAALLPDASGLRHQAGASLRELRELAGLTIDELAEAIELSDRSLLKSVEAGTASLSFELILRLAAILARHDPVPFISEMLRSYNPVLWQLMEEWGVGRLPLQLGREREFVNILRSQDEARGLSDEDFAQVLEFTRSAFATGLHFAAKRAKGESGE